MTRPTGRRRLLAGALTLAGGYLAVRHGLPAVASLGRDLTFEPLPRPEGFRRIAGGRLSLAAVDPFVGIGDAPAPAVGDVATAPCTALHGGWPKDGAVPIASFSDYNCPVCRVTTARLMELDTGVRLTWHEWPIFGPSSVLAARAVLAGAAQGAHAAMMSRLLRSRLRPTPAYIDTVAADLGLDLDRLHADMTGTRVTRQLAQTAALARLFGLVGTPAMVVGRTLVQGDIDRGALSRLIAAERRDGPLQACADPGARA